MSSIPVFLAFQCPGCAKGEPSPLKQLPIQYADFSDWQREYLSVEILETQLDYRKQEKNCANDLLQKPT
ncbi:MAG: hypothetical protein AAGF85_04765, partial [Bacteroidota bacterium]